MAVKRKALWGERYLTWDICHKSWLIIYQKESDVLMGVGICVVWGWLIWEHFSFLFVIPSCCYYFCFFFFLVLSAICYCQHLSSNIFQTQFSLYNNKSQPKLGKDSLKNGYIAKLGKVLQEIDQRSEHKLKIMVVRE